MRNAKWVVSESDGQGQCFNRVFLATFDATWTFGSEVEARPSNDMEQDGFRAVGGESEEGHFRAEMSLLTQQYYSLPVVSRRRIPDRP